MGKPIAVQRAARAVDSAFPDVDAAPREEDRERLVRELARRWQEHDWHRYNWADLQRAARALLEPGRDNVRTRTGRRRSSFGGSASALHRRPEFRPLVPFLLDQVHGQAKTRFLRTMWRLYLSTFKSRSRLTRDLARRLHGCWREAALPIQRAATLGVLKPESAVKRITGRMMKARSPFESIKKLGIEAPHGEGLMADVHEEFVRRHSEARIRSDEAASGRLLNWIAPEGRGMEAGAELGIHALLAPWARAEPTRELRKRLWTTLIRGFGDPRVSRGGAWTRCDHAARAVMMRWLAGETIELFFEIISKAVTSHMWGDRRGLWMDMYRNGSITEAWFALSPYGVDAARRLRHRQDAAIEYARNTSRNSEDRRKCLLLMRINGRLVAEGSHNFKTHIYRRGDNERVTLYETAYDCDDIRQHGRSGSAEAIAHYRNWRRRVVDALEA